jgi:hypothetical protein
LLVNGLQETLNLREILLYRSTVLVSNHEVIVNRLAVSVLHNCHATFAELESEVTLTLAIDILAMPLLLTILIISGHFTVENCIAVVTEVNEAIASLSTEITIHIEILENVLLIEASAGSHQQSVITSLIGTSYIAHIFCIENSVSYYCCILYVLATESCYGH